MRITGRFLRSVSAETIFYSALAAWFVYLVWRVAQVPLMEWDEARNILNAFEMVKSGDWIAARWGGELDHYNLKPPLFMWILAAIFSSVGYSEVAARLPSIVFGLATAVIVYRFVKHVTGEPVFAAIAGLGLVTAASRPWPFMLYCYYGSHGITSADVDVALTFFTTLAFVAIYMIGLEGRPRWYLALGAALGLGFMTKSLVGLLPVGLVAAAFVLRRDAGAYMNRWLPAAVAIALFIGAPWLVMRELRYSDEYMMLALQTDILKRSTEVVESHAGDLWFYLDYTLEQVGKWFYLALFSVFALAAAPTSERRTPAFQAAAFAALGVLFYFVVLSIPTSKFMWYLFPAYPLVLIVGGIGLTHVARSGHRRLAITAAGLFLALNLAEVARYDNSRSSGNPLVDHILMPNEKLLRGNALITQGDIRQNGFALTRIYSGLRAAHFPNVVELGEMLRRAPDATYLVTTEAQRYANDRRLEILPGYVRIKGQIGVFGIFRIIRQ